MNKHTQGKWVADGPVISSEDGSTQIARADLGRANVPYIEIQEEERANAKLIAAAPELLEALTRLLKYVVTASKDYDCTRIAELAIKKATL